MKIIRTKKVHQPIEAMAIINPKYSKDYMKMQVEIEQTNEGPIPHIHVYLDKTRNSKNCAWVRLDKSEYMPNHNSVPLTGKYKKEFLALMNQLWVGQSSVSIDDINKTVPATGYSGAVQLWNDTYGISDLIQYDEDGFPIMPNYENL